MPSFFHYLINILSMASISESLEGRSNLTDDNNFRWFSLYLDKVHSLISFNVWLFPELLGPTNTVTFFKCTPRVGVVGEEPKRNVTLDILKESLSTYLNTPL